ncbi:MAG: hypothetical protein ACKOOJ_02375 [Actinomycetota bacterium]
MAPFSFSKDKKPSRNNSRDRKSVSGARPARKTSDRPARDGDKRNKPRSDRPRGDRRRPLETGEEERRQRSFETPPIPAEITGEELEKKIIFQLESLTPGNAKSVARHLVALERFLEEDPQRANLHGKEISFRAGRLAIVRERAGVAALRAGFFKEALKDLRAALRIGGSIEMQPFIAQCEAELGNARKALEIAGSVDEAKLSKSGRVEMRIAAAKARSILGQNDAAVVTLKCSELNTTDATWSKRLHKAYRDALIASGEVSQAKDFEERFPQSFS